MSYRNLEIYKESKRLAIDVHKMTMALPRFELFEEGGQVRRSSKAITANIVEGYGRRRYKADYIKHLIFSLAECDETCVHLDFLFETKSLNNIDTYNKLKGDYDMLSKKINRYIQWVETNLNDFSKTETDNRKLETGTGDTGNR